uniref:Major facilitator superfamily (MFS) profile domain-containing protein n=1 Tax=Clastoptera arizonana TaxID=38151 RepID=A0A1B6DTA4_9HEMI
MEKIVGSFELTAALEFAGFGKATYISLLACGFACSLPYLLSNQLYFYRIRFEETLNLTTEDKKINNIFTYVALTTGTLVAAVCSEMKVLGRRSTLISLSLIHTLCLIVISIIRNKIWYILFKTMSSFSASGAALVGVLYCEEFSHPSFRGSMTVTLQLACLFATLLIPFGIVVSLVPLISAILMIYLPENPLFLLSVRGESKALLAIKKIYSINNINEKFLLNGLKSNEETANQMKKTTEGIPTRYAIISLIIANFLFSFSYYALVMWYPGLLPRHDFFHQVALFSSKEFACDYGFLSDNYFIGNQTIIRRLNYAQNYFKVEDYFQVIITVSMSLPVLSWMVNKIDVLGRKFFVFLSLFTASIFVFWSYYVANTIVQLLFSGTFYALYTMFATSIACLAVEVSKRRAITLALVSIGGHIGTILGSAGFVLYFNLSCFQFTMILSLMMEVVGLLVLFIAPAEGIPFY